MKIYGHESANGDFPCAKLQNVITKKNGIHIDQNLKPYLCNKFGDLSLKNEYRNAKRGRLIKWSIMRIFDKAEPP